VPVSTVAPGLANAAAGKTNEKAEDHSAHKH
jgi:hypothetical protein